MIYRTFKVYKNSKEIGIVELVNHPEFNSFKNTKLEDWDYAIAEEDSKYLIARNPSIEDPTRLSLHWSKQLPKDLLI